MAQQDKGPKRETLDQQARRIEREILNAFTVERRAVYPDGTGAPGSTGTGDDSAGGPAADAERGKRD